jgi:uncharacterized protein (TIGR02266 family)
MGGMMDHEASPDKSGSLSLDSMTAGVKQPDGDIPQLLQAITEKARELDGQEHKVDLEAQELENLIRVMSLNPNELVRRKNELEGKARAIRDQRLNIMVVRKQLENIRKNAVRLSQKAERPTPVVPDQRDRVRISMAVEVTMHTETNFYTGLSQNISEGGLFIATYEQLSLGTLLDLSVILPGQSPIKVRGEVRWVRELSEFTSDFSPGLGVAFTDLPEDEKVVIEDFLRDRSPLLYEMDW